MRIHILLLAILITFAFRPSEAADGADEIYENMKVIDTSKLATEDHYVAPTLDNLSKLYWAIGKMDIDDDEAIDNYLLINECDLYLQYYHNDFEWSRIREATRAHIQESMGKMPTRFELMSVINLGRYDIERQEFEVMENDKIMGVRRIDFNINFENRTCHKPGEVKDYPANMVVVLNRPLVLEKVPVEKALAELYIAEAKQKYESLSPEMQMWSYERLAFLRIKVQVTQYKNTIRVTNGALRAVVFGNIEGFEIYADPDKQKPLYTKDLQNTIYSRVNDSDGANPEEPKKPEYGGFISEAIGLE